MTLPQQTSAIGWISAPRGWSIQVAAGISTRSGGVSQGWLAQANYSLRVGDDPARVAENRRRLAEAADVPLSCAAGLALEHGARIHHVDGASPPLPGDGLVTTRGGLPLALTVADCLPLMLAAERRGVALVHCGWRGITVGIAAKAVAAVIRATGCEPSVMDAWIGPGIGPCCFNLPAVSAALFPSAFRSESVPGFHAVDLAGALTHDLQQAGLAAQRIHRSRFCTACRDDLFYSHRRDRGRTGRMLAWIMLEAEPAHTRNTRAARDDSHSTEDGHPY
ncbi:MAG: polyphenol oxidase family protein [Candidatus Eisenbacteria bacterium]